MPRSVVPAIASPNTLLQESQFSTYSQTPSLSDRCSQNDVFQHMVGKLEETASQFEDLQSEYSKLVDNSKKSRLRNASNDDEEEYPDILSKKGEFVEKLASSIGDLSLPLGFPQYRIQCYQELSSELNSKYHETNEKVQNQDIVLKKMDFELQSLSAQSAAISNILNRDNNASDNEEIYRAKALFNEAKTDLDTVLSALYSNEVKQEFTQAMAALTKAYLSNIGNEEGQFVELSGMQKNAALLSLIKGSVLICHPTIPKKFRLCLEDGS